MYAIQETLPAGVARANIGQGGNWDSANLKVKWGPFFDDMARTLTYTACGDGTLNGVGSFDGVSVPTTGPAALNACGGPAPIHQLTAVGVTNGLFGFLLNGPAGYSYIIQASSDLVNWLPVSTNTVRASGSNLITGATTTSQPRLFYRAVELTP